MDHNNHQASIRMSGINSTKLRKMYETLNVAVVREVVVEAMGGVTLSLNLQDLNLTKNK